MSKSVVLRPRASEKAYGLSEALNTYVFDVSSDLNKFQVADAVNAQYEVDVKDVRLANVPGKAKRTYKGRSRFTRGKRADIRKAYVRLAKDQKLPLFNTESEKTEEPAKSKKDKKDK